MVWTLEGVPPLGGSVNHKESTEATYGWDLVVPPNSGGAKGCRDQGVGGIHQTEAKQCDAVY